MVTLDFEKYDELVATASKFDVIRKFCETPEDERLGFTLEEMVAGLIDDYYSERQKED